MSNLKKNKKKQTRGGRTTTQSTKKTSFLIQGTTRGGRKILHIRNTLGFTRRDFARLVPASERTLASIEGGQKPSAKAARDLIELQRIVDALGEVIDAKSIGDWLRNPNEAFDGLKPMEVIERGEADRIWEMIFYLRSGIPG